MPPKPIVDRADILDAAIALIRERGIEGVNAREIARVLECSTKPLFRVYASMDELKADALSSAYEYYNRYFDERLKRQDVPPYKASGLAYIQFARDERELFKLLFMRDRTGEETSKQDHSFRVAVGMIMKATGISEEAAVKLHLEMWVFVHGIATLIVTSYFDFDDQMVSDMMADIYRGVVRLYTEGDS